MGDDWNIRLAERGVFSSGIFMLFQIPLLNPRSCRE